MHKTLFLIILPLVSVFFIGVDFVSAASCSGVPISGNYTVSSSCTFANTVDGVEAGNLTINEGTSLTINSGYTVAWNSGQTIYINGSLVVNTGGTLKKTNLWMIDADNDHYPATTTQYAQDAAPTNGKRRSTMISITAVDPQDSNAACWQNLTCYKDNDGDTYPGTGATRCKGASCASPSDTYDYDSATDCYDSNANAKPGQTTYYTTHRGDGSFDYNCDSTITNQYIYCCDYGDPCVNCVPACGVSKRCYSAGPYGQCVETGSYITQACH